MMKTDRDEAEYEGQEFSRARFNANVYRRLAYRTAMESYDSHVGEHRATTAEKEKGVPATFYEAWTSPAVYSYRSFREYQDRADLMKMQGD